jgi:formamidopyrimidine-DNA glycosylase
MLEIPESGTISRQAAATLNGKVIVRVEPPTSRHKYAFFCGDPAEYTKLLSGRRIMSARGHGMFVDILCDDDVRITIGDGTIMRYYPPSEKHPDRYQMLIGFDDGSFVVYTVAMYGGIWAYKGPLDNPYHGGSLKSTSPLSDSFDESYFDRLFMSTGKDLSMKALLATEQRIPGLGNGVLQDILFNASLNPKRKKSTITEFQKAELFHSLKVTLKKMTDKGGRDTERDLFGKAGGYKSILSKLTFPEPCPNCGTRIVKEAYLGGAVYYCPSCQPLK